MEKRLLALTRPPRESFTSRSPIETAEHNMRQLVQLRWLAVVGQLAAILTAHFAVGVVLPLAPMLAIVGLLALANLVIGLAPRRMRIARATLAGALALDMAGLTAQLFFSGGTLNPFIWLYLLQIALAAILLPIGAAVALTGAAAAGFGLLSFWRHPLLLPQAGIAEPEKLMLAANWLAFAMVAGLLVLFVVRITRNLRARDAYLAELRERGAQEEGVLRVGLFASGAAHELGTPLSSLAVLVGDWQRHPAFLKDPHLKEELADAAAEVQRCKETVSRILDSAGRTRGEAMGPVEVSDLLEEIVAQWSPRHACALLADWSAASGTRVTGDPALRQAIASLLDNAREAHTSSIELAARIEGAELALAIKDRGEGFTADMLAEVGRPFRSAKGQGRGIGLFLAATVARRLGGRLTAENRPDGGAVVTIRLPIVRD